MKRFTVAVKELRAWDVEVLANSEEEAKRNAVEAVETRERIDGTTIIEMEDHLIEIVIEDAEELEEKEVATSI